MSPIAAAQRPDVLNPGQACGVAWRALEQAQRRSAAHVRQFIIAGRHVRLWIVGDALIPVLIPAFAHLETEPAGQPDLTIVAHEAGSVGGDGAGTVFGVSEPPPGRVILLRDDGGVQSVFQSGFRALSVLDQARKRAVYRVENAALLPDYEKGFPLRLILHRWLASQGLMLVHAAAVATEHGAVLLVGKGGSGKSTAALACRQAGMRYLGDDYVAVGTEPEPRVWSLYGSAKLHAKGPLCPPESDQPPIHLGDKRLLFLRPPGRPSLADAAPLKGLFWPRVTGEPETRIRELSSASLLLAAAPSTVFQMPGDGDATLRGLAGLAKRLPAFCLESGTRLDGIPRALTAWLAEH